MSYPIIDVHTHLGDVLYPNGGDIIENGRVRKKLLFDPMILQEWRDWKGIPGAYKLRDQHMRAGIARSATATRANMRASMNRNGIDYCVVMAVPPAVTFDHLHAAYEKDRTMLPFTGVDYADTQDLDAKFASDVARGARGLKLHPILQRVALNSSETFHAVEAFAPHGLPVLFHSGWSEYYVEPAEKHLAEPNNGHIEPCLDIIKAFPQVNFIIGHAGIDGIDTVIELLSDYPNAYVDISFQGAVNVKRLLDSFGPERVMYASDWPWGNQDVSLRIVNELCYGDPGLKRRLLCDNAAELLRLNLFENPERELTGA